MESLIGLQWTCDLAWSSISALSECYLSSDGGKTWNSWLAAGNEHFINYKVGWRMMNPSGGIGELQKTYNGGETWEQIRAVSWATVQFSFVSERVGWAVVGKSGKTALLSTVDGGFFWQEIRPIIAAMQIPS